MSVKVFRTGPTTEYHVYESPDCLFVNPAIHFAEVRNSMNYHLDLLRVQSEPLYSQLSTKSRIELAARIKVRTKKQWIVEHRKILTTALPVELKLLLQETKKKAQQKLLKGVKFTSVMFMSIPLHAWQAFKMPYSKYTVDYVPKELSAKTFPTMLHMKGGSSDEFTYIGDTNLSNAEMKLAIEKRNRIISEFIGDEDNWHCFFRTMAGIKGTEEPHIGHPHLHYISSAWGISRKNVIEQLTSYRYSLKAETIPFEKPIWDLLSSDDY